MHRVLDANCSACLVIIGDLSFFIPVSNEDVVQMWFSIADAGDLLVSIYSASLRNSFKRLETFRISLREFALLLVVTRREIRDSSMLVIQVCSNERLRRVADC